MGRGSSKITGSYVRYSVSEANGASWKTDELVKQAIQAKEDGRRRDFNDALNDIKPGQKITTYSAEVARGTLEEIKGVANDPIVWEKMDDGTWRSNFGGRRENSDLARRVYNGGFGAKLAPGEISTESHLDVPSKGGRTYDGLTYVGGTYDVQIAGKAVGAGGGARKFERKGNITTYNGTMYGVTKDGGEYTITHIPTGLSVGAKNVKSMKDASSFIRSVDKQVKTIRGLDEIEERFKKTIRGD